MRIRSSRLLPYRLPLIRPWLTHHGSLTERRGWILELTTDDGNRGYGDCAPLPVAGTELPAAAFDWLRQQLPALSAQPAAEALAALPLPPQTPAARHALETALLDLLSQSEGVPLRHRLSPNAVDQLLVNGSAGALDSQVLDRCVELIEQGFRILKVKVGLAAVHQEVRQLQELCRRLPEQARLRLDANGAWSLTEARRFLDGITGLAIESLEEPLVEPVSESLRALQTSTRVVLAMDESLPRFDKESLLQRPPVKRLILKPPVLGGLLPTLALAKQAHAVGIQTLITSTLESAPGLQAAAQLAAALPGSQPALAQGLATGSWFLSDLADGPVIEQGRLQLPDRPGLGLSLKSAFLDQKGG